ncbi:MULTISPECIES: hypothetical protein [Sphingobacterium]|jgi:hypothetical protein|nr:MULTISPECIES: hypothetical protein [Sphingobacterium]KKX47953.1 hypothetical protein L950_0223700 [Sphingobacterium sp. IITKGP-BTPF85]MCW2259338.1 hypothetical protein [Sphingobacterium kitahiroshimense]
MIKNKLLSDYGIETTAGGFLVFFPFAGNQDIATNTYKRIDEG